MLFSKNIAIAEVEIMGTRPVLWHWFGPETLSPEKKERTGVAGNDPEEWKKTVLMTKEGQLYFDPGYIFACIRDGAKYTKKGRMTLQSSVSATLQVKDDKILVDRFLPEKLTHETDKPVYLDVRSVKNPVTKGRNMRYRIGASPGWKSVFHISWDITVISKSEMKAILIDAGMFSGIADARNIGFGRFKVVSFNIIEDEVIQGA